MESSVISILLFCFCYIEEKKMPTIYEGENLIGSLQLLSHL